MHKLIIITLLSLLLFGCEKTIKERPKPILSENILRDIAVNAINGKRIYNDSLSGLIDYSLPLNSNFNALKIERLISPVNKTFFAILIEYPNPIYNRFAVYDSALHLILIDKSLNGKIVLKTFSLNERQYIEIDESFLSKDVLELNRVSLYRADSTVTLGFRTFTKFTTPQNEYYQIITEIFPDRIKNNLTSTKRSLISDKSEIFTFDDNRKKYLSTDNIFINFIKKQASEFKRAVEKPEITDENSVLQSVGITKDLDTIKNASNINGKSGYYLAIDEGWKEIRDIDLYGFADRLRGNKYYNPMMGTNIFIALIPQGDSAEVFIKTGLRNVTQGKYRVRFTDKIEQKKFYLQYFEFSCGKRKYLMIFEASKYTYEKYKATYQDIINSFTMEC
jgi:hypothetical protein